MNNHFPPAAEKIVADYLEKLKTHLKGMNEKDQQEVLAEIRSHLFESFAGDGEGDEIDRALRALKRLGEPAGTRAQEPPSSSPRLHGSQPAQGVPRPDQDRGRKALGAGHHLQAPVDSIAAEDLGPAGRAEHAPVAPGGADAGRGGGGGRIAADFLIGGHAAAQAERLLTRDLGFYKTYFKGVAVVSP